ncbi:TIGR04104 family putative zinc finger protein [Corticicoccus populi]|uniref:TIGR04104 family putative zinc finger protein n=1 Tax=Corticicoccus populi TaxID=1812821 RepID=A0ABW5WWG9_9STAP
MTRCTNCDEKWTAKTKIKGSVTLDRHIICPECGEKQYLSAKFQRMSIILVMITSAVLILTSAFFDVGVSFIVIEALLLFLINIAYIYFGMTLTDTDETMDAFFERFEGNGKYKESHPYR